MLIRPASRHLISASASRKRTWQTTAPSTEELDTRQDHLSICLTCYQTATARAQRPGPLLTAQLLKVCPPLAKRCLKRLFHTLTSTATPTPSVRSSILTFMATLITTPSQTHTPTPAPTQTPPSTPTPTPTSSTTPAQTTAESNTHPSNPTNATIW